MFNKDLQLGFLKKNWLSSLVLDKIIFFFIAFEISKASRPHKVSSFKDLKSGFDSFN